jgi:hypothetical protein
MHWKVQRRDSKAERVGAGVVDRGCSLGHGAGRVRIESVDLQSARRGKDGRRGSPPVPDPALLARPRFPKKVLRTEESPIHKGWGLENNAGDHLISHTLTRAVPSAQRGLTSVFGMGTGVTLAVNSPAKF